MPIPWRRYSGSAPAAHYDGDESGSQLPRRPLSQRVVTLERLYSATPCVAVVIATIGTGRFTAGASLQIEPVVGLGVHHEFELRSGFRNASSCIYGAQ
jgi:hypothetical protein